MKFISVCSGIEAASLAWQSLGWRPQFYSEVDKFPSAVLDYRHPEVPNLGDMTKFKEWSYYDADVLVGGTPCQSFSVAGLRKGLDDPRGNLMLTYLAIADRYRPEWVVWENVPGVLSSNGGRDFGTFLGSLGQLGYGFAYRVLDAQHFGVPQRRRRVFVVGCLGGWQRAAAVLFESESMSGHPPPGREKREVVAALTANGVGTCGPDDNQGQAGHLVAGTITAGHGEQSETFVTQYGDKCGTLTARYDSSLCADRGMNVVAVHGTQDPIVSDKAFPLGTNQGQENAVYTLALRGRSDGCTLEYRADGTANAILTTNGGRGGIGVGAISADMSVRRLTTVECERLQGFPDNYTLIPWRNKQPDDCPDGPRYKALGNSMAVPVMKWIGERINKVQAIKAV